jgi:hypothetical protein
MKYSRLGAPERKQLLQDLESMPQFLANEFLSLPREAASRAQPDGSFSPVEHCWHLADLECEGYAVRIERLLKEDAPTLPDFDGARIAEERRYRTKSLPAAIDAFRAARLQNLAAFADLGEEDWSRSGQQEGVGKVALCDLPAMMAEHDRTHRAEIEAWRRARS